MNQTSLKRKLQEMIDEDRGAKDITTAFTPNRKAQAEIIAKERCTVAGIPELKTLFSLFNIKVTKSVKDGTLAKKNQRIIYLSGKSHDILVVERTALNILSRMSGIASLTSDVLKLARKGNPDIRIAATRKTTPLFGYFEKRAVEVGGGDTHRMGLWDAVLLKDNHLKLFRSITDATKTAKKNAPFTKKIEIEVSAPRQALEAAGAGSDIILLDNLGPGGITQTISLLEKNGLRKGVALEASGGITPGNVKKYAKTGVDVISLGMLTHSAKAKDFSLKII